MVIRSLLALTTLASVVGTAVAATACSFCAASADGKSHTFDLSSLSTKTFALGAEWPNGTAKTHGEAYTVTTPCGGTTSSRCGPSAAPMQQGCKPLGHLAPPNSPNSTTVALTATGFNVTLHGGFDQPKMPHGRNAVYVFICDKSATGAPEPHVLESPGGFYQVHWRTPAACAPTVSSAACAPPPPAPAPLPPPADCMPGSDKCLPSWKPSYNMSTSTVLYTCNNSGMHNVQHANKFGIVVYDWSNAKAIWANAHPMSSEELITKQADMVYADRPGVPGYAPRVWAYRNTIKALNWYSSVRKKLDDPKYAGWFIKFKGFKDKPYPGGISKTAAKNGTFPTTSPFHVPSCAWYGDAKSGPPKCSGFYHDQEQTPEHEDGKTRDYKVDGACVGQCDCGKTNPCAEYIFDHRGGEVDGQTFRDWWINEYMISNETLHHKNPTTGKPQVIGLGWLDDSMKMTGPTEEDTNYIADTCGSNTSAACVKEITSQVEAYQTSVVALKAKVVPMGGFWWQLMGHHAMVTPNTGCDSTSGRHPCKPPVFEKQCNSLLRAQCTPKPLSWSKMTMYNIERNGDNFANVSAKTFTDYTAEFLLTRGPYAILGYSWCGCTTGEEQRPRAKEWDEDFGKPLGGGRACHETAKGSGIYEREWSKASVSWDCKKGHGKITRK